MEAAAKRFEQEDGILDEIIKQIKADNNMYSYPLSNMFQKAEADGYTPYCEIKLHRDIESYSGSDQLMDIQECAIQSQCTSMLCSELEDKVSEVSDVTFVSASPALCSISDPFQSYSSTTEKVSLFI